MAAHPGQPHVDIFAEARTVKLYVLLFLFYLGNFLQITEAINAIGREPTINLLDFCNFFFLCVS